MSEKRQLILDVDTGTDDAIAIMAALLSPEFEVLGICTVSGNLPLANTTENTLRVVSLLAPQVPVIRGCAGPIVRDLDPRRKYCDNEEVLEDEDGKILKQVPGKAAYSATLVKYAELICKKPCAQGVIVGFSLT